MEQDFRDFDFIPFGKSDDSDLSELEGPDWFSELDDWQGPKDNQLPQEKSTPEENSEDDLLRHELTTETMKQLVDKAALDIAEKTDIGKEVFEQVRSMMLNRKDTRELEKAINDALAAKGSELRLKCSSWGIGSGAGSGGGSGIFLLKKEAYERKDDQRFEWEPKEPVKKWRISDHSSSGRGPVTKTIYDFDGKIARKSQK